MHTESPACAREGTRAATSPRSALRAFAQFAALFTLSALLIALGVLLGEHGPWYFAWIVGSAMLVLVSAAAAAWFDVQQRGRRRASARART